MVPFLEKAEEDLQVNECDTQGRRIEVAFAKVTQKGREFIGADVPPFLVALLCSPLDELVEGLADGELVGGREASLGREVKDEPIDLKFHHGQDARQPGQFWTR